MTREELLSELEKLGGEDGDLEQEHVQADQLLLDYIGDPEIRAAFEAIDKWYA